MGRKRRGSREILGRVCENKGLECNGGLYIISLDQL